VSSAKILFGSEFYLQSASINRVAVLVLTARYAEG